MKLTEEQIREKYTDFIGSARLVPFNKIPLPFYEGEGLWGWKNESNNRF